MKPPRPFSVTLLAIGVLTLAIAGLLRAWAAIRLWDFLTSLETSPIYQVITGLIIGLTGLPIVWGLWQGLLWVPRLTLGYVIAILVFFWLDRIFIVRSDIAQVNTPFSIAITILVLVFMFWVLHREKTIRFFSNNL